MSKACSKCGDVKPLDLFSPTKYGFQSWCKACAADHAKRYRLENRSKVREQYRRYRQHNKDKIRAYNQSLSGREVNKRHRDKYNANNSKKVKAHKAVYNALKRGTLVKPDVCSECSGKESIHGHHDDYSMPLTVRWLCQKCHIEWHNQKGEGLNSE